MFKKFILLLSVIGLIWTGVAIVKKYNTGAPPYLPETGTDSDLYDELSWLNNWKRPDSPPKVGIQIGHYKNNELPEELERLRGNTGASGGGKTEVEVNQKIAELTKDILEKEGILVELLPATVPPRYWADVFVAVHADGNLDRSVNGFKVAAPRRDYSGNSESLSGFIQKSYVESTNLTIDPNISRNMRGYYAFSWRRFKHAIHPMTAAAILETGFLSNASDRKIIVNNPQMSAQGLSNGIINYLMSKKLL